MIAKGRTTRRVCWPGSWYGGCLNVCAVDLGASSGLAAYLEHWDHPGGIVAGQTSYSAFGIRSSLVADLDGLLATGSVALGLEGPCWGAAAEPLGPLEKRWFESPTSAWYDRSGGPAALKAAILGSALVARLTNLKEITDGTSTSLGDPGVLWLWEAYVFGDDAKAAGDKLPIGETWCMVDDTRRRHLTLSSRSRLSQDRRDAFAAVRYGFAADPNPLTGKPPPTVVPIVVPAIAAATGAKTPNPSATFLVVEPAKPTKRAKLYR
jgi:hypothetical protein